MATSRKIADPLLTVRLRQAVGVAFGVTVIVGNTIGAGILRTPGEVAAQLPSPFAFFSVWFLGGVYALLGAVCLAELGTLLPASGGQYVHPLPEPAIVGDEETILRGHSFVFISSSAARKR